MKKFTDARVAAGLPVNATYLSRLTRYLRNCVKRPKHNVARGLYAAQRRFGITATIPL